MTKWYSWLAGNASCALWCAAVATMLACGDPVVTSVDADTINRCGDGLMNEGEAG